MLTKNQRRSIFVMLLAFICQTLPFAIDGRVWVACVLFIVAAFLWGSEGLG